MHLNRQHLHHHSASSPPRLRAPFREELERRLEGAHRDVHHHGQDVRAIAAEVLRSMRRRQAS